VKEYNNAPCVRARTGHAKEFLARYFTVHGITEILGAAICEQSRYRILNHPNIAGVISRITTMNVYDLVLTFHYEQIN
jgi:hypothetical protein